MVGVSPDAQEDSDRFRAALDLPFALAGDPSLSIARSYGALWPVVSRVRRVTYVIGIDRRIRRAFQDELRFGAHVVEACAAAESASAGSRR